MTSIIIAAVVLITQDPLLLPLRRIFCILRVFDWTANSDTAENGMCTDDAIDLGGCMGCGERQRSTGLSADLDGIHLRDGIKVDAGRVPIRGPGTQLCTIH